jgi:hypothetical protein
VRQLWAGAAAAERVPRDVLRFEMCKRVTEEVLLEGLEAAADRSDYMWARQARFARRNPAGGRGGARGGGGGADDAGAVMSAAHAKSLGVVGEVRSVARGAAVESTILSAEPAMISSALQQPHAKGKAQKVTMEDFAVLPDGSVEVFVSNFGPVVNRDLLRTHFETNGFPVRRIHEPHSKTDCVFVQLPSLDHAIRAHQLLANIPYLGGDPLVITPALGHGGGKPINLQRFPRRPRDY